MSVFIGEHIRTALGYSEALKQEVGTRIFPVTYGRGEDVPAEYPYIIYSRESLVPDDTLSGEMGEHTSASILITAKTYGGLQKVVGLVRESMLEHKTAIYDKFRVLGMEYQATPERFDYDEGAYYTTLDFVFTTEDV